MPFENEHSARLKSPDSFEKIRRKNDEGGPGIDFLFGITKDDKSEIQAIRFDRKKFTVAEAKKWLADHDFKPILFEEASGGEDMSESLFWERDDGFEWKIEEQGDNPKLENKVLNLREKDFQNGRCGLCRYFGKPETCKILEGPVGAELVCDGFQGLEEGFPSYQVSDDNWLAFVRGMVKEQPYQHVVVGGHLTPAGPIVIIKDTIKPKPHIFSLSKSFHIGHTSTEHHWTQEDVDRLIKAGGEKVEAREAFHVQNIHWVPVPESGSCPASHPKKMRSPGDGMRCFTNSAAEALEQSQMRASEAIIQFDFVRYFEVLNNQAHDLGDKVPENLEPLTTRPGWALIQEDRQTNQSFAQVIRENLDEAGITVLAREMIERKKEPRLVVVVGRAIGKLDSNRTIYRGLTAFGWDGEQMHELVEGIRPPFGSTGGKKYLAPTIVRLIPDHSRYVEPFIGGGAVFFAKKRSESEVINDLDGDISHAYRFIQGINESTLNAIRQKKLTKFVHEAFFKIRDSKPTTPMDRFHRFLYLNAYSFGKNMTSTISKAKESNFGPLTNRLDRLPQIAERLKKVTILNEDFRSVIRRNNSPSTFFYLDPPYPEQQCNLKTDLTNETIRAAVSKIRGKFILSLPDTKSVRSTFKQYQIKSVSVRRTLDMKTGHHEGEVLIANFPLKPNSRHVESVGSDPFVSESPELGALDVAPWLAKFNFSGAMLDLDLWSMDRDAVRALGRQLSEANGNADIRFRQEFPDGFVSFIEAWMTWAETSIPKERERLRGAHIAKRFRNMRGLAGNLAPEDEKRMDPFHGNREIFAVAIETPEKQPARVLRIGEEDRATAERLARDVAKANLNFRVVLAKVVGMLDGQEVFEIIADADSPGEKPTPAEPRQEPAPAPAEPRGEPGPPVPAPISDDRPI